MPRYLICALSFLVLASCAHATREQLVSRAGFDLDCPPEQLEVVEIDDRTRGVRGCGKKAVYIEDCRQGYSAQSNGQMAQGSSYEKDCTWVLNADARPAT